MFVVVMDLPENGILMTSQSYLRRLLRLQGTLSVLHDDLAYGDLRSPNVIFSDDKQAKLLGFDWAGVGYDRVDINRWAYPA